MYMLTKIGDVTQQFGISHRSLHYWEDAGILTSRRAENDYRYYDEANLLKIKQIVLLRKLRIPLKQIGLILQSESAAEIIETFRQNLNEVNDEITALSTIRDIISGFIARLNDSIRQNIQLSMLDDTELLDAVDALTMRKERPAAEPAAADLAVADAKLSKLRDFDVRIVYLPPAAVAAIHATGAEPAPENETGALLSAFVTDTNLRERYPAARHFGFNNPDEPVHGEGHGYERYITIPDDMEVPTPFVKKQFTGGLYAAHTIPVGAWDDWMLLHEWVVESERYDFRWETIEGVCGWIEEHLNYWEWDAAESDGHRQIDLVIPIRPLRVARTQHPQERIVDTFNYNGAPVEVVEWNETIWCGAIGYAENNTDEPDVDAILNRYFTLDAGAVSGRLEPDWTVCMSVNYFSKERPNGVLFGSLTDTEKQPDGFDIIKLPAGQYIRNAITDEAASAVGAVPWNGGIPPYEWVLEQLAPQFGYWKGDDRLPVFEYYGFYNAEKNAHEFRYLYVPVQKIGG